MKKGTLKTRLAAVLFALVLAVLPACTFSEEESPVNTEAEGTLIVIGTELTDQFLQDAVKAFTEQYPNVTVNYKYKTAALTTFTDDVLGDLSLSDSMDLIVFPYNWYADIETLLRNSEAFADINQMIDSDDNFQRTDYVENVIDSCEYNGKQVFMPISYTLPVFLTTQENLNTLGIEFQDKTDLLQFFSHITQFQREYDIFGENGVFYSDYPQLEPNSIMALAGIQPMNYETKEVDVIHAEFNESLTFINTFKYSTLSNELFYSMNNESVISEAIKNRQILFTLTDEAFTQWYRTYAELSSQTALYYPTLSVDGRVYAHPLVYAGIPESSTNKELAYLFVKTMLSEEMQNEAAGLGINIPVRKESIDYIHDTTLAQVQEENANGLSMAEAENYLELIKNPEAVSHYNHIYRLLHSASAYAFYHRCLIGNEDWQTSKRLEYIESYFKDYIQNGALTSDEEMEENLEMYYSLEYWNYYGWEIPEQVHAAVRAQGKDFE